MPQPLIFHRLESHSRLVGDRAEDQDDNKPEEEEDQIEEIAICLLKRGSWENRKPRDSVYRRRIFISKTMGSYKDVRIKNYLSGINDNNRWSGINHTGFGHYAAMDGGPKGKLMCLIPKPSSLASE